MTAGGELQTNRDMLTLVVLRSELRDEVLRLAEKRGAHNVRAFGSVARAEATEHMVGTPVKCPRGRKRRFLAGAARLRSGPVATGCPSGE